MTLEAIDLKNDDTTDAGFDLVMDPLSSPAGKVGVTKIMIGATTVNDGLLSAAVPLPVGGNTAKDGSGTAYALLLDTDGHQQVDVLSSALPTGAATAANQSTALTSLQLIDDVIYADSEAWTAGSNKHELIGGVYESSPGTITDGDTSPLRLNVNGAAHVDVQAAVGVHTSSDSINASSKMMLMAGNMSNTVAAPSLTLANSKIAWSVIVEESGEGSAVYTDDQDWTDGSSKHVLTGGVYQSSPQSITDGDVGPFQVTENGYLITSINGTVTVGSHAVTNAGTFAVQVNGTALTRLTDIETNTDYGAVTGGGVESSALRVTLASDSTGVLSVDDNGGSLTVDGTVTANLSATDNAVLDNIDTNTTNSATSAIGTNSDTVTSGGNWSSDTYTGSGEQNDYQYVAVSLQTDETGTLYFDFSNDGSNWSTFPVAGFTIASGTHEYHGAHKAGRYFRPRFVGSGGRSYFRLYTYYTNSQVQLNAPLNFSMSADSDGAIVKSAHVVQYNPTPSTVTEGSYDTPAITRHREIRTRDQAAVKIQRCDDYTEFTALGNDTLNLADTADHIYGSSAVTFDKVNGAANTVYAGIQDTIASVDGQEIFEMGSFVGLNIKLPSIGDVVAVQLRLGTDSSNYNEWEWPVDSLSAGTWLPLRMATAQPERYAGNGWDPSDITYVAAVVEFSAETDTLAGIVVDNIYMVSGRVTDATTDASIVSSISSPNINIHKVGNKNVDTQGGNVGTGTQRVTIATDDANLSAIKTAVELIDNAISGSEMQVDVITSALPSGAATAANQSTANTALSAIQTAVEILDNVVSGSEAQVDIVASLPAGTNAIGKLAANSGVDIGDVDVTSLPAEMSGPGTPTIDSYTSASVSLSAGTANQSIVAAPGTNKQIWIYGFVGTADTGDGSISLQDEDDTAVSGVMPVAQNGGFAISPSGNFAMPWAKVATNKALEGDTVTCGFKGVISYAVVDVS